MQVCVFAFDLLYLDGRSLVCEPLSVRRDLLRATFAEQEGRFMFAKGLVTGETEEISMFLDEAVKGIDRVNSKLFWKKTGPGTRMVPGPGYG